MKPKVLASTSWAFLEFYTTKLLVPSGELTQARKAREIQDGAADMNRKTSRREFLAASALLATGFAVRPSLASSNQPDDKEKPKGRNTMNTRKLGGLTVSEIGAGCMSISSNYGPPAPKAQG